jgi:carboxymethylenebutenolidase
MRRFLGIFTAVVFLSLTARATAADVQGKEITFKSGGEEVKGFLAEPTGPGPHPGIVVIQEWWGLTDWIKDNAKRLAGQGYVCLAPDLYHGKVAENPMQARELMMGLPRDRALRDLKAAVDTLAGMKNVDKNRLGSIGWCMGGGYSLQLALADDRVKACTICYGAVITSPTQLKSLNATVLGIFGEEDKGIPPKAVKTFEEVLKSSGKKIAGIHEFKAGHGFMRPTNPGGAQNPEYREAEAKKAWEDVEKFFAQTLGGK